jgi:DNA-binding Lrp family transcriptional regulator
MKQAARLTNRETQELFARPENILDRLDLIDVRILRKFYMAGPKPYDLSPYVQITLKNELAKGGINLSVKAVALRLAKLVSLGLVERSGTTPRIYVPRQEARDYVVRIIAAFSANLGLGLI